MFTLNNCPITMIFEMMILRKINLSTEAKYLYLYYYSSPYAKISAFSLLIK